jgi:dTDP-4-amino-4,6-dideoxygalactose transaminase
MQLANKYEIPVIEDSAEALGSSYNDKKCGSFGKIGILSFNGNKIITTSGGGALISESADFACKAKFLSTQSRDKAVHYQHSQIGYNYRMSNVLAGIGRGQLKVIDLRVNRRREIFRIYKEAFSKTSGISFQSEPDQSFHSNRWLTCINVDPLATGGLTREVIRLTLEKENIESRPLWKPMHLQPVFSKYPSFISGASEMLFNNGLCLPSGSNLENSDLERIIDCVNSVFI